MGHVAYDRIYRDLKQAIENGIYGYEELLPSQSRLVKHYQCAHNTVRKAIARLANQGYCLPIHGKGVRVIWRPDTDREAFALGGIETFAETARRNGVTARTQVMQFDHIVCDEQLSRITGFEPGTNILHIERVRLLDERPLIRDKSYFRESAVEGITPEQAERSVYAYVEDVVGLRISTSKRTISMEPATETDRQWLDIEDCLYLAKIAHSTYDSDATLFEYAESRYHPAYFRFHDTVTRKMR
ncbi:MAG: UTRA domain-containing protein [Coriobacteriales bacterium]|nr:UTRA domain-containing protein [Coriobacteriales bacterium]